MYDIDLFPKLMEKWDKERAIPKKKRKIWKTAVAEFLTCIFAFGGIVLMWILLSAIWG